MPIANLRWCTPAAVIRLACLILAGYALFVISHFAGGFEAARRGETPLYTDFVPKYAASLLLRNEPAGNLYIPERMAQAEAEAAQAVYLGKLSDRQAGAVGFSAWMYPPVAIFAVYPLAAFSYWGALCAWLLLTAAPYVACLREVLRDRAAPLLLLAAPPTLYNVMYGQTGFLSAGLIGLGLTQLQRRPVLAGICLGAACIKPHFGILVPLALVLGGHWKPFGVATITVVVLVVASVICFGMDPWYGMIGTAEFYGAGFDANAYHWPAMVTVLGALRLAGVGVAVAAKVQMLSAVAATLIVAWAWWRGAVGKPSEAALGLQSAVVCAATLLAVPMAYLYDLPLLIAAVAWLWADMRRRGAGRGEQMLLAVTVVAMLPLKWIATTTALQYGPLLSGVVLYLAVARLRSLPDA